MKVTIVVFILTFFAMVPAWAVEVYLTNGDKISGEVIHADEQTLTVKTVALGDVVVNKAFIDTDKTYPPNKPPQSGGASDVVSAPKVEWTKTVSLGYTKMSGNTKKSQAISSAFINRKTNHNEATFKFDSLYSSNDQKIDAKKFYGLLRYAYSYGANLKWYNFYKLEGQQDRFADIDYRLIPSGGRGYWFSNTDNLKAMMELAIGYQYTNYRIETKSEGVLVLVPRLFIDKRLAGRLHLSEDFTLYPALDALNNYRYRSETSLVNQINERWALKLQFIREYDSDPAGPAKKSDDTWITALDYKF